MQKSSPYYMRVKENRRLTDPACTDVVVELTLEPEAGGALQPFLPGQFVRLGIPEVTDPAPAYFAIASSPEGAEAYELFVKCTGGIASYLCELKPGAQLEVEGPMGKAFDLTPFKGCDVYLIGVGTGIAPLRSVWGHIIRHRGDYGKVAIYAGFLTPLHHLLTDELDALAEHDIDVSVTLETAHENWNGPIGYVQDALMADAPSGRNAVACLAGMSTMVDACTETLHNLGFNDSRILLNF